MAESSSRRVELVADGDDSTSEAARTGAGLIIGMVLGRNSLVAAATGSEQFEFAIAHFVGLVLASVAGALVLGTLWDRVVRTNDAEDSETEPEELDEPSDDPAALSSPANELALGMPT